MNLKFESHEVRQDGRCTRLRFDWGGFLARFRTDDGKAVGREVERSVTDPWGPDLSVKATSEVGMVKQGCKWFVCVWRS